MNEKLAYRLSSARAAACLIVVLSFGALLVVPFGHSLASPVPSQLTDQQFWSLSRDSSEEDGFFRSDNLLSNETTFQYIIPDLLKMAKQGRVYMGVGPEQNFTYIAALKPAMAVIVDIRHGNLDVHLMYKALFEIAKDRAEFVSLLFSRKRPDGLTAQSSARQIFSAYLGADGSRELFDANLRQESERPHVDSEDGNVIRRMTRDGEQCAISAECDQQVGAASEVHARDRQSIGDTHRFRCDVVEVNFESALSQLRGDFRGVLQSLGRPRLGRDPDVPHFESLL